MSNALSIFLGENWAEELDRGLFISDILLVSGTSWLGGWGWGGWHRLKKKHHLKDRLFSLTDIYGSFLAIGMFHLKNEIKSGFKNLNVSSHHKMSKHIISVTPRTIACQAPLYGILQAQIPFSTESPQPRDQSQVSHISGRFFTIWATGEAQTYCFPQYASWSTCSETLLIGIT